MLTGVFSNGLVVQVLTDIANAIELVGSFDKANKMQLKLHCVG
jgi:hypothetical protein